MRTHAAKVFIFRYLNLLRAELGGCLSAEQTTVQSAMESDGAGSQVTVHLNDNFPFANTISFGLLLTSEPRPRKPSPFLRYLLRVFPAIAMLAGGPVMGETAIHPPATGTAVVTQS